MPTASVRSVGVFHAMGCHASAEREGEGRRADAGVVKEKILQSEHTKSVSMPSAQAADAGTEVVLLGARAGRVKLLLLLLLPPPLPGMTVTADGAPSGGCWDDAGRDMAGRPTVYAGIGGGGGCDGEGLVGMYKTAAGACEGE